MAKPRCLVRATAASTVGFGRDQLIADVGHPPAVMPRVNCLSVVFARTIRWTSKAATTTPITTTIGRLLDIQRLIALAISRALAGARAGALIPARISDLHNQQNSAAPMRLVARRMQARNLVQ